MNDPNNWQKLAQYPTNLLAETHAIYLQNNGINVQTQLVDLMGLNTGGVLWVASLGAILVWVVGPLGGWVAAGGVVVLGRGGVWSGVG
ncbi:hypothetical protein KC221_21375, partial [Mycobacterium tuberculosis]|nr:hypothetical protein [Mycobacterium tuberculosis]